LIHFYKRVSEGIERLVVVGAGFVLRSAPKTVKLVI